MTGEYEVRWDDHNENRTHVYFLHGGLHLWAAANGYIAKHEYDQSTGIDLLRQITNAMAQDQSPLYVSEANYHMKLSRIMQNYYLQMCYHHFCNDLGSSIPLVIYGHNLDETRDQHLVRAIAESKTETIYYGIYDQAHELNEEAKLKRLFPSKEIFYFRSADMFG